MLKLCSKESQVLVNTQRKNRDFFPSINSVVRGPDLASFAKEKVPQKSTPPLIHIEGVTFRCNFSEHKIHIFYFSTLLVFRVQELRIWQPCAGNSVSWYHRSCEKNYKFCQYTVKMKLTRHGNGCLSSEANSARGWYCTLQKHNQPWVIYSERNRASPKRSSRGWMREYDFWSIFGEKFTKIGPVLITWTTLLLEVASQGVESTSHLDSNALSLSRSFQKLHELWQFKCRQPGCLTWTVICKGRTWYGNNFLPSDGNWAKAYLESTKHWVLYILKKSGLSAAIFYVIRGGGGWFLALFSANEAKSRTMII